MLKEINMKQYVIIAGAGISAAPPSNLPSWWEYNKKLIVQIKAEALKLCPEAMDILDCIDVESTLPVQCISQLVVSQGAGESYFPLLELLNGTIPNENHFALVKLAQQGLLKAIVTTNFDTLIETAFLKEAVPLYTTVQKQEYYESTQIEACKLFKIHGSVYDDASLIDTVEQKAIGLSSEKRVILENVFSGSDILVIGFSGADLDFDLNYIPISQALKSGSKLTWVIRPNSDLNPNVIELQRMYPKNVCVCKMELPELFKSFGIDYRSTTQKVLADDAMIENEEKLEQRIKELFSSVHIGTHGCIGYCLSLLEMIGDHDNAKKLARIYEEKLDWGALDVFAVLGVNALARHKLISKDWHGAIRCYNAVIQCHQQIKKFNNELQEKKEVLISSEQVKAQEVEYARNLVATYLNLCNVYYYMTVMKKADTLDEAKRFIEMAQSLLHKEPDIPYHSMVSFNLARIEFQIDQNYDCYLNALHISREYAKKEGRLNTLAEIILEECKIRMLVGEYHLAWNLLEYSQNILKNVGQSALKQIWGSLHWEYQLRTGEQVDLNTEEVIQKLISKLDEPERKAVIILEIKKEKEHLAMLFLQLCVKYMKKEDWQRLSDLAQCCYAASCTNTQKSDALYMLGCAAKEQANYWEAERCFRQIIDMGKGINDLKLGWAHSELASLFAQRDDISQSMYHFDECLHILLELGDMEQLTQAGANCIKAFFCSGHSGKAEVAAAQLLMVIEEQNAVDFQDYLKNLRLVYNRRMDENLQSQPAYVIATEAIRLYDAGETKRAWELMRVSKSKYEETEDLEGIGRCENNMGIWCQIENNYEDAVNHIKMAMDIKFSMGDVGGGIKQLSILLQLYITLKDIKNAETLACYAEQNMPIYSAEMERYFLYCSLFFYKFEIADYAAAYIYAQKASEGIQYLSIAHPDCIKLFHQINNSLQNIFTCQSVPTERSEFEIQAIEAEQLGKIGKLNESIILVEQLRKSYGNEHFKNGILNGICANAYLKNLKYTEAVDYYVMAIKAFNSVDENEKEAAMNHKLTAINGMALALRYLGKSEDAIALLSQELKRDDLSQNSKSLLTVSLCNSLILLHKDALKENDDIFIKVSGMLKSLIDQYQLNHEEQGCVYCSYGMLYMAIGNDKSAKYYYQQAKKEFLIVNSQHLTEVEMALAMLQD